MVRQRWLRKAVPVLRLSRPQHQWLIVAGKRLRVINESSSRATVGPENLSSPGV
jgi:hypothetical protein